MKNKKLFLLSFLTLFPVFISLLTLKFLPSTIPVHYDIFGNADRIGSKIEVLYLPIFIFIFGCLLFFLTKKISDHNKSEKILSAGILSLTTLNILNVIILFVSF